MKHLKKLNEDFESEEYKEIQPKVKHLIEYLSTLDPEADVVLDKNGWDGSGETELDIVKTSGLFWYRDDKGGKYPVDKPYLIINN